MNQQAVAMKHRVEILPGSNRISRFPGERITVAHLNVVLTWPGTRQPQLDDAAKTRPWSAVWVLVAVTFLAVAFTAATFCASYLYGLAAQQLHQFQRYCNPQGMYYSME